MKKEIVIKRLKDDCFLSEMIKMHREIFEETEFYGKLIYFDDAFSNYLRNILYNKNHYFFGVFNNNNIYGFLHLKEVEDTLFLNNIYLDKLVRGNGVGTNVLYLVLTRLLNEKAFNELELDVLKSNVIAKKWYEKLGLTEQEMSNWYFAKNKNKNTSNIKFELLYDENNFKSLFFNDVKVATVIKDSCIITHNIIALNYECDLPCIWKTENIKNTPDNIELSSFDASIRMKGNILKILKKIKNV